MRLYYLEFKVGEEVRYARVYARSFGQAKMQIKKDLRSAEQLQQVSAGYLKKMRIKRTAIV